MFLDERGADEWKTASHRREAWDVKTGFPKRKTFKAWA
jgi:hypothetical protein